MTDRAVAEWPPDGTRVRVVVEGVIAGSNDRQIGRRIIQDGGLGRVHAHVQYAESVQVLPDPEPAWWPPRPGDVASIGGAVWLRTTGNNWICRAPGAYIIDADVLASDQEHRDVTLLVRDGKPYVADEGPGWDGPPT